MHVDRDECLELDPLYLGEVSCGLVDERVQQFEELVVGLHHDLLVLARLRQRQLRVSGPDHLDAEQAHLLTRYRIAHT